MHFNLLLVNILSLLVDFILQKTQGKSGIVTVEVRLNSFHLGEYLLFISEETYLQLEGYCVSCFFLLQFHIFFLEKGNFEYQVNQNVVIYFDHLVVSQDELLAH